MYNILQKFLNVLFLVHPLVSMVCLSQVERRIRRFLKRAKREWRPPPFNIMENGKGPFPKDLDHVIAYY